MAANRRCHDQIVRPDHLTFLRQISLDLGMNARNGDGKIEHELQTPQQGSRPDRFEWACYGTQATRREAGSQAAFSRW